MLLRTLFMASMSMIRYLKRDWSILLLTFKVRCYRSLTHVHTSEALESCNPSPRLPIYQLFECEAIVVDLLAPFRVFYGSIPFSIMKIPEHM